MGFAEFALSPAMLYRTRPDRTLARNASEGCAIPSSLALWASVSTSRKRTLQRDVAFAARRRGERDRDVTELRRGVRVARHQERILQLRPVDVERQKEWPLTHGVYPLD